MPWTRCRRRAFERDRLAARCEPLLATFDKRLRRKRSVFLRVGARVRHLDFRDDVGGAGAPGRVTC